jgi:hypothetical protein
MQYSLLLGDTPLRAATTIENTTTFTAVNLTTAITSYSFEVENFSVESPVEYTPETQSTTFQPVTGIFITT